MSSNFEKWITEQIATEQKISEKENPFIGTHRAKATVLSEVLEKFRQENQEKKSA